MVTPEPLPQPFIALLSPQTTLEEVGGKGLNLIKLARAGFPVPNAFLIPTESYWEFVNENHLDAFIQDTLANIDFSSPEGLSAASVAIRTQFERGAVSPKIASALWIAWRWLGAHPVAVRSSATAEDLPDMSFAGQQDTFLNIIDDEALSEAVVKCWSSLWTARAIGYRARNNISQQDVSLCVIVQNMVQSDSSGVLFTANPLTGCRTETVIDATLGLGEALVGGYVEPDNYVVNTSDSHFEIIKKSLGSKSLIITGKSEGGVSTQETEATTQQAIPDEVILELAEISQRVAELYNFPQDIEWAYICGEEGCSLYILQSRPITSLYPLPKNLPLEPTKFLMGLQAVQGVIDPYTPLGQDLLMLVLTGGARLFKLEYSLETQTAFYIAAERIFLNLTAILRSPLGNKIYPNVIRSIDPGVSQAAAKIVKDPRFAPIHHRPSLSTIRRFAGFMLPLIGRVIGILRNPERKKAEVLNTFDKIVSETKAKQTLTGDLWTDFSRIMHILHETKYLFADFVIPIGVPPVVAGMAPFFGILQRFSLEVAQETGDERFKTIYLEISRGMPDNVTTEMDLALWDTAQILRSDPLSKSQFENSSIDELATGYLEESLTPTAHEAVVDFLDRYGARGLGEIDIGRQRWDENPTHILQILQSYLAIDDPSLAPDAVFERGAQAAQEAAELLVQAVRKLRGGGIKTRLVRFAIKRYRALGGMREAPKFFAIRMMSIIRQGLLASGRNFVEAELIEREDDLFFLRINELDEILENQTIPAEIRSRIDERRALRKREKLRKQIPRVFLSDGTAFYEGVAAPIDDSNAIVGDPVSPGIVEGKVKVVLNPHKTQLTPGEILVCPGTDPAWTPLFLAAGGLVMEVGGMMTHGSVVAREYGIPAVVGVHQATTRLETGQRVRVNGSTGEISVICD
ncbi:MAG: phosphoenolpyruvate synthase [Anaerolineales bacterium]|nr:phosphoenolpyruvate synthase [Chloroflexota bacterium]MBL6981450.1 phosphoenolpyruvate synthase [Anaerolineales bacterium]